MTAANRPRTEQPSAPVGTGPTLTVRLARLFAVGIAYFLAGYLGLQLAFIQVSASPVWPATGLAIAAMILVGYEVWPVIFAGAFLFNVLTSGHAESSLAIAFGNTMEAFAGAYLANRFAGGLRAFDRFADAMRFFLLAGLVAPMVSATIGVGSLTLLGLAAPSRVGAIWLTWWLGDAGGAVVVAPALLLWLRRDRVPSGRGPLEWAALLAAALCAAMIALGLPPGFGGSAASVFWVAPLLLLPIAAWSIVRMGTRATSLVVVIVGAVAIAAALAGRGPFVGDDPNTSFLILQLFLISFGIGVLGLAASAEFVVHAPDRNARTREAIASLEGPTASRGIGPLLALPLVPIMLAVVLGATVAQAYTASLEEDRLHTDANIIAEAIVRQMTREASQLYDLRGLWNASAGSTVTRAQFQAYVESSGWRSRLSGVQAVEFTAFVPYANLSAFVRDARSDTSLVATGYPNFTVHPAVPVGSDAYVVDYIDPLTGNEPALGLNLGFNATRLAAVREAITSGGPVATGPITLVQETSHEKGFLLLLPVYAGAGSGTGETGKGRLVGLVNSVHRVGDMMAEVARNVSAPLLAAGGPAALDFQLLDAGPAGPNASEGTGPAGGAAPPTMIFQTPNFGTSTGTNGGPAAAGRPAGTPSVTQRITIFGRSWVLVVDRPATLLAATEGAAPWFILFMGGALTVSFAYAADGGLATRRRAVDLAGDMTRRVRANEARLRALYDSAPIGIAEVDLQGRLVATNHALQQLLAGTDMSLRGHTLAEFAAVPHRAEGGPQGAPAAPSSPAASTPEGLPVDATAREQEVHLRSSDGHEFWALIVTAPIRSNDAENPRTIALVLDVTPRRLAADEHAKTVALVNQLAHLQEIVTFKTRFLNTVAHELYTPLTPIRIVMSALMMGDDTSMSKERRSTLQLLDRNVERLTRLVADLLDASRLDAGKLGLLPRRVDMSAIARDVVATFEPLAAKAGLELRANLATAPLEADPDRLAQIVTNLVSNAVKYTPPGGRVLVETRLSREAAVFRVKDTGIGIPPEARAGLFQPFSRAHSPDESSQPGTGLGLYLVKALVDLHGGRVMIDSPGRGRGTTVTVLLPLQLRAPMANTRVTPTPDPAPPEAPTERIVP
ncbi:MAG: MASE1 domain-containing protein [Thermoplasmatota archaeon]